MIRELLTIVDNINKEAPAGQITEAQCKEIYLRNIQYNMKNEQFVDYAKDCDLVRIGYFNHTTMELIPDQEVYGNLYELLKRPILENDIANGAEKNEI